MPNKIWKPLGRVVGFLLIMPAVQAILIICTMFFYITQSVAGHYQISANELYSKIISYNGLVLLALSALLSAVILLFIIKKRNVNFATEYGVYKIKTKEILLSASIGIISSIIIYAMMNLMPISYFTEHYRQEILDFGLKENWWQALPVIVLILPLFEELLFRVVIYKEFFNIAKPIVAIILQALIFAIYHFNLVQFAYALPVGIILGFLYYRSGSIWVPVCAHMFFNLTSAIIDKVMY